MADRCKALFALLMGWLLFHFRRTKRIQKKKKKKKKKKKPPKKKKKKPGASVFDDPRKNQLIKLHNALL